MTNHVSSLPLEGCGNNRPAEATPCDNGPCTGKVEWFAGSWSQVSDRIGVSVVPGEGSGSPRYPWFGSIRYTCQVAHVSQPN